MRLTRLALTVAAALFAASAARAAITDNSAHDLRQRLNIDEICLPCHAPHNAANAQAGPIWNHALSNSQFTRHNENVTLSGASKLCMSCHDGVTAVGNYGKITSANDPMGANSSANLGTDLTDDHPIGVEYPVGSHIYVDPTDPKVASLLEDGKVECSSCHRAHSDTENLLRINNTASALCRTCHTF